MISIQHQTHSINKPLLNHHSTHPSLQLPTQTNPPHSTTTTTMKFLTAAAAATTTALLSATALAAPTDSSTYTPPSTYSCPNPNPPDKETTTYQIKDFSTRKYDGKTVSTLSFRILATTGGTLDFECIPYDPVTKGATQAFESGKVYFCGENTFFSFSYTVGNGADKKNELFLWQEVSEK